VLSATNFWEDFNTGWVCIDAELMPWSAKAQKLLEEQYAPVGRAGRDGLSMATNAIRNAINILGSSQQVTEPQSVQSVNLDELHEKFSKRQEALSLYTDAYRRYCWDVKIIDDYRIAPFHILATEGKTWNNEDHIVHMDTIAQYMTGSDCIRRVYTKGMYPETNTLPKQPYVRSAAGLVDSIFIATDHLTIDLLDENSVAAGIKWWEDYTNSGGEGMVVKPFDFISLKGGEILQPAVKCRGREYLRIIYGPEYLLSGNLERLKKRGLGKKRNLALNEFALGMEALERFTGNEPLHRVHECVFGILALESEPVDPRL
jgi:protein phosphatase